MSLTAPERETVITFSDDDDTAGSIPISGRSSRSSRTTQPPSRSRTSVLTARPARSSSCPRTSSASARRSASYRVPREPNSSSGCGRPPSGAFHACFTPVDWAFSIPCPLPRVTPLRGRPVRNAVAGACFQASHALGTKWSRTLCNDEVSFTPRLRGCRGSGCPARGPARADPT